MRLDKYLKVSRIIKRRTIANEACDAGKVEVNGKIVRASYDVKIGDVIKVTLGNSEKSYKVLMITEHALKEDASKMFEQL
ncbi:MAG: RNA-binding S4 domain-containing protein [Acetobacter sp.]|nr:RNA-binding S4 domain-containing protein [Bacteroides sp.]MCM1340678.1 RNA-binding S4 domain-containing protein [Acetobacter sp.]MCM1433789.1 RNA-binding S4 domain-containing protein [Clostridiales bacterium]